MYQGIPAAEAADVAVVVAAAIVFVVIVATGVIVGTGAGAGWGPTEALSSWIPPPPRWTPTIEPKSIFFSVFILLHGSTDSNSTQKNGGANQNAL